MLEKIKSIEQLKEAYKEQFGRSLSIEIDSSELDQFIEDFEDNRLGDEGREIILSDRYGDLASVYISEPFECCGKLYAHEFEINGNADKKVTNGIFLLKACEILAGSCGYTCLGYIHKPKHASVKAGLKLGFLPAVVFKNKRSGNKLAEMYKII